MATVTEKSIELKVCRWARDNGWLVYKFTSPSQRGVPDRLFIKDGRVVFIEFKRPGHRPTRLQAYHINTLVRAGVIAEWADSVDSAILILTRSLQ